MLLSAKYNPKTIDDIKLQDKAMDTVISWANSWLNDLVDAKKPALLLHGNPGTGKTATANCIASDCGWDIIEMNAGDARSKSHLEDFTVNPSLSGERTCIILDEIDQTEKSGELIFKNLILSRQYPIILTANNMFGVRKELKDVCEVIEIKRPSINELKVYLYEIIQKEHLSIDNTILNAAANTQDYRLALTMIENNIVLSGSAKRTSNSDYTRQIVLGEAIDLEDPKNLLYHLDENCHALYSTWDLGKIYAILSHVDQLRGRGQIEHANNLLKTIPKTTLTEFEIVAPIKYNKPNFNNSA